VEDWYRFARPCPDLVLRCKTLRHRIREQPDVLCPGLLSLSLSRRDAAGDCGPEVSVRVDVPGKDGTGYDIPAELLTANWKRVQEGLRSLEEISRLIGRPGLAQLFEKSRYHSYELEKMCFLQESDAADGPPDSCPGTGIEGKAPAWHAKFRGLYGITAADPGRGRTHADVGLALLEAGVRVLQYRGKSQDMCEQYRECAILAEACRKADAIFIVNDRLDLALAAGADGVHLGQEDLPLPAARRIVRDFRRYSGGHGGEYERGAAKPFLIGISTHSREQAEAAVREGADYIGIGPVFATSTKTDLRVSVAGLDYLSWTSRNITLPQVAIGGISPENLSGVLGAGGVCCAMISSVDLTDDITAASFRVHSRILTESKKP